MRRNNVISTEDMMTCGQEENRIDSSQRGLSGIRTRTAHLIEGIHKVLLVPVLVGASMILVSNRC